MADALILQLFVAGRPPETAAITDRIRGLLDQVLRIPYDLQIVDVLEDPQLADLSHILVTPTLVVRFNDTERRFVGDLSDLSRLQLVIADVE